MYVCLCVHIIRVFVFSVERGTEHDANDPIYQVALANKLNADGNAFILHCYNE